MKRLSQRGVEYLSKPPPPPSCYFTMLLKSFKVLTSLLSLSRFKVIFSSLHACDLIASAIVLDAFAEKSMRPRA